MKYDRVYLNPSIDYVFCYLKETVIEEKDCDYYEYNRECEKNEEYLKRTHRKGSHAGYREVGRCGRILNSCKYCLEKGKSEEFLLPSDAIELFNKNNNRNEPFIRRFCRKWNIW